MRILITCCALFLTFLTNGQKIKYFTHRNNVRNPNMHLHFFLQPATATVAKNIKLDFEPRGKIIKFKMDSLIIYTDTTALFNLYRTSSFNLYKGKGNKVYEEYVTRIRKIVSQKIKESTNDTVTFQREFIGFNDGIDSLDIWKQNVWYIKWAILNLTDIKKLKLFDKQGKLVKRIKIKEFGNRKDGGFKQSYFNKNTNEELFSKVLFTPR